VRSPSLDALAKGFAAPPDGARAGVYWYFMDGNWSAEGVRKDLAAMREAGLAHVTLLEVGLGVPRGPVAMLSKEWKDLVALAARECGRLGIGIVLGTGPGWAGSGGPWVPAEQSMQHVVASSLNVTGKTGADGKPVVQRLTLPPPEPKRPFFAGALPEKSERVRKEWLRDIAVIAFPAGASRFGGEPCATAGERKWGAHWSFPQVDGRALYYRQPFSSEPRTEQFLPTLPLYAARAGDAGIDPTKILDLTARLGAGGALEWAAPAGEWTVMRFAARNSGAGTRPAPEPGWGFECDKFDAAAFRAHLDHYAGAIFRHCGFAKAKPAFGADSAGADAATGATAAGGGFRALHIDSWEMGAQNWSPRLREEFRRRRGYDPLPYLPAVTGVLVKSRELSERFLWDLRLTAQELVVENHVGTARDYARRHGLELSIEPYDMTPAADLELAVAADTPQCEFWQLGRGLDSSYSVAEAASASHLLGRAVLPAEAFTSHGDGWRAHPASVKNQGEWAFAAGINRFYYHTFQHQPLPDALRPGMTMGPYGVHWDRNQTWWRLSRPYHDYVARCQFLLQQGRAVADILYLTPEGAPHIFQPPASAYDTAAGGGTPERRGYNFDGCPPSMLHKADVAADGSVVFPGGARYRLLVLPKFPTMTPRLLRKIADLAAAGATVVGLPPVKSPSLADYPQGDDEVRDLARKLWGETAAGGVTGGTVTAATLYGDPPAVLTARPFGKGKIVWGAELLDDDRLYPRYEITARLLAPLAPPDFEVTGDAAATLTGSAFSAGAGGDAKPAAAGRIRYTHRALEDTRTDIYFVSNRDAAPAAAECAFRVPFGRTPALWDPVTGARRPLPDYSRDAAGRIRIPLRFAPNEGYFVVFDPSRKTDGLRRANFAVPRAVATLGGPWRVAFDPAAGGPAAPVTLPALECWTRHADPAVRFYSGAATYTKTFDLPAGVTVPAPADGALWLDLGDVKNIARVRLNGVDLGVVWTAPWRVNAGAALRPRGNQLEIEVVNLWSNRLIGDAALPRKNPAPPPVVKTPPAPSTPTTPTTPALPAPVAPPPPPPPPPTPRQLAAAALDARFPALNRDSFWGAHTFTTHHHYRANTPLQPSGLLGPVTLQLAPAPKPPPE